jgi:hypothetical protein
MGRRKPDWRMRSTSVEGEDTTTSSERGPQGPGGTVAAKVPHFEADVPTGQGCSEGSGKPESEVRHVRIRLNSRCNLGRPVAELAGAWCLKPYWGKPVVRNFREGGWKRDYGRRNEAQRESLGKKKPPNPTVRAPVLYPTEPYGKGLATHPGPESCYQRRQSHFRLHCRGR